MNTILAMFTQCTTYIYHILYSYYKAQELSHNFGIVELRFVSTSGQHLINPLGHRAVTGSSLFTTYTRINVTI